ncbi:MAG: SAM-dependent methyltransferase [Crocinitomicaceae bacterium]|nr:SAM-dependent methyltransferase [Crocinitomicaceae bacterium]|tara:strand:+ start:29468 stop:30520 length:1053 start_codon:yes stop_codon:yes gene_type:complete
MKAIDALNEANKIAFSPFVFQTVYTMLELGILEAIHSAKNGISIKEIENKTNVSEYGIRVLCEMAESAQIIEQKTENKYSTTKIGFFIVNDKMTLINLYFTQDVCYNGLYYLKESILNSKPEGLKVFGNWKTIYEGLASLPDKVKKSWFDFDHFYSDNSFDDALKIIFKNKPKKIFDIGGNTGKWSIACTKFNKEVNVTMFDLPGQINVAKKNIEKIKSISNRIEYQKIDLLNPNSKIPEGADVYWMSQFLDCFSEEEIEKILLKIKENMSVNAKIYIMETFIDDQRFKAASHSLIATSLYFTALANGNSKMYSSSVMKYIVNKAGFKCINEHHLKENSFHTILELELKK